MRSRTVRAAARSNPRCLQRQLRTRIQKQTAVHRRVSFAVARAKGRGATAARVQLHARGPAGLKKRHRQTKQRNRSHSTSSQNYAATGLGAQRAAAAWRARAPQRRPTCQQRPWRRTTRAAAWRERATQDGQKHVKFVKGELQRAAPSRSAGWRARGAPPPGGHSALHATGARARQQTGLSVSRTSLRRIQRAIARGAAWPRRRRGDAASAQGW